MPLPPDFAQQAMYTEDAWYLHDVEFFPEEKRIVGVCDTTKLEAAIARQRPWPGHPKHLPGAVAVQITGTLGQLYTN